MAENIFQRVIQWLRAGYPQGIPENDYIALFSLLHRALTKEEVEIIARGIAESRHPGQPISDEEVAERIRSIVQEEPSGEDIQRVSARLAAAGWPSAGLSSERASGETEPTERRPDPLYSGPDVPPGAPDAPGGPSSGGTMTQTPRRQAIMPAELPAAPAVNNTYAYGVRAGDTLHIAGMVSFGADGTIVGEGDIAAQVDQALRNMAAVVAAAGGSMDDVVATTTYLVNVTDAPVVSAARARWFTGEVKPTHTLVGVAALGRPAFLVEIEGTAWLG